MKVTVNSKKGLKVVLEVIVEKQLIKNKITEKFEELKQKVNLKGFRPGKVPVEILKKQFGKAVYGEVLEKTLRETSTKALEDKKIKVAGQPNINLKSHGEDKDLKYIIDIEQLPEIKTKEIDKIKSIDYEISVSDKDVDKRIKEIAKNQNNFIDKKDDAPAVENDLVVFDYKATIDDKDFRGGEGKNTQIILGKDLFIKDFDKQLIGVKKNQNKLVNVVLPDNYPDKEYSNKKAKFNCKIINVKEPQKVKINDEFAKNIGTKDFNDLKSVVSKQIRDQYKNTLDSITKKEILDQLTKFKEISIPNNLVQQEMELMTQGISKDDKEKNKKETEKKARQRIKVGLILNEYGEQNNLKVTEQELKNEIQKQIQMTPNQSRQVAEYYQKNPSAASSLRGGIYEDKIINLIKKKSSSVKKNISVEEAEKIIINQSKQTNKIVSLKDKKAPVKKIKKKVSKK